ncbi:hypothetical protein BJY01DRAFT_249731 [Aspergillus pseudoustus]|uniref:Glycosyl hydrolase n=1 Tax=Aspergillus pseudoustus TaxID=1810923 RepID=A0ABR4JML9_9EURO
MYIAYGTKLIEVAQLSPDGLRQVTSKTYKINGTYYIWVTKGGNIQCTLQSSSPFDPYEVRDTITEMRCPMPGAGPPHRGALVDTPDGQWCYMAFMARGPDTATGPSWSSTAKVLDQYPHAAACPSCNGHEPASAPRRYDFRQATALQPCWEWNQNPDNSKWRLDGGRLVLAQAP